MVSRHLKEVVDGVGMLMDLHQLPLVRYGNILVVSLSLSFIMIY